MEELEEEVQVKSFKAFLENFNRQYSFEKADEEEFLQGTNVTEDDFEAEVLDWALQYLLSLKCPSALAAAIARTTLLAIKSANLEEACHTGTGLSDSLGYQPSELYHIVVTKVHDICQQYQDVSDSDLRTLASRKENVSMCAIKNGRRTMEDRHVVIQDLNVLFGLQDHPPTSFFAVFDGHAGTGAACYAAVHLHYNIIHHPCYPHDIKTAMKEGFMKTDKNFVSKSNREGLKSGSTALCCLLREKEMYLAWLGDSQAILVRGGAPIEMMKPHKPDRDDERERIEKLGGCVVHFGTWRVNGTLAVSRAIGDAEYKPFVSGDPDVEVTPFDGTEDFVVLACDGLWDVLQPKDVVQQVYSHLSQSNGDVDSVAAKLVQVAKEQGSSDNITVLTVFLRDVKDLCDDLVVPETPPLAVGLSSQPSSEPDVPLHVNGNPFDVSEQLELIKPVSFDAFGSEPVTVESPAFDSNEQMPCAVTTPNFPQEFVPEWEAGGGTRNFTEELPDSRYENPFGQYGQPGAGYECPSQLALDNPFYLADAADPAFELSNAATGNFFEYQPKPEAKEPEDNASDWPDNAAAPKDKQPAFEEEFGAGHRDLFDAIKPFQSNLSPDAEPFVMVSRPAVPSNAESEPLETHFPVSSQPMEAFIEAEPYTPCGALLDLEPQVPQQFPSADLFASADGQLELDAELPTAPPAEGYVLEETTANANNAIVLDSDFPPCSVLETDAFDEVLPERKSPAEDALSESDRLLSFTEPQPHHFESDNIIPFAEPQPLHFESDNIIPFAEPQPRQFESDNIIPFAEPQLHQFESYNGAVERAEEPPAKEDGAEVTAAESASDAQRDVLTNVETIVAEVKFDYQESSAPAPVAEGLVSDVDLLSGIAPEPQVPAELALPDLGERDAEVPSLGAVVDAIPDTVPVADDVEDDESEDGEEWKFYRSDAAEGGKPAELPAPSAEIKELPGVNGIASADILSSTLNADDDKPEAFEPSSCLEMESNSSFEALNASEAVPEPEMLPPEKPASPVLPAAVEAPKVAETAKEPGKSKVSAMKPAAKAAPKAAATRTAPAQKPAPASRTATAKPGDAAKRPLTSKPAAPKATAAAAKPAPKPSAAAAPKRTVAPADATKKAPTAARPKPLTKAEPTAKVPLSRPATAPATATRKAVNTSTASAKVSKEQTNVGSKAPPVANGVAKDPERLKAGVTIRRVTQTAASVTVRLAPKPSGAAAAAAKDAKKDAARPTRPASARADVKQTKETVNKQISDGGRRTAVPLAAKARAETNGTKAPVATSSPKKPASIANNKEAAERKPLSPQLKASPIKARTPLAKTSPLVTKSPALSKTRTPVAAVREKGTTPKATPPGKPVRKSPAAAVATITKNAQVKDKVEEAANEKGILDATAKETAPAENGLGHGDGHHLLPEVTANGVGGDELPVEQQHLSDAELVLV